ncbi:MAG: hypothetical protein AAGA05_00365 [Pseudomonadota bacterium]
MVEMGNSGIEPRVLSLVSDERRKALSLREWKFRLAGYGYTVEDRNGVQVLKTISNGAVLGVLPGELA